MKKERADKIIAGRGLAESRQKAQALIMAGLVFSEGQRIEKPGQMIDIDKEISLKEKMPYVSRGGLKLEEALEAFKIPVKDKVAADLGASTGGFIDCLLQKGADRIYAVDVDIRQIDWRLREDPRIICIQKNARYLRKDDFGDALDIVTTDLSFISVLKVLPAVKKFLGGGRLLSLIKPQFEVGKGQVGKKGVVRNPALHEDVLVRIIEEAHKMGFALRGLIKSSHRGQKGNREFFIFWSLEERPLGQGEVKRLIKEAVWNEKS
jgi:23S rRNA (cytidine1920-2'-O)/16S rRNA (cytidine1409-2'-O)-methyltransferase